MELRRHNVEVNNADPFANDWLERKGFADQLTNIVENNKQGEVVIGLSGQWGEGKTTFVEMWQKHMENKNIASIYFDAFEYDYLEDVFLSLAIEIYNYAKVNGLTAQEDYLNKSKNTYHLLQAMIAKTSPINIDSSFQEKLVDNDRQLFDIAKIIEDNLNFSLDNAFEQALKHKEVFRDFKKSLSQLATQASNQDMPLVVIIDELDRCKPSFAVEVQYNTQVFTAQVDGWRAQVAANTADSEMQSRYADMNTRTNIAYAEMQISEYNAKVSQAQEQARIALEAAKAAGQYTAQLAAGAMSAAHVSASISGSGSASVGSSDSESESTSHNYSY